MIPDGTHTAVVDRIEDGPAALEVTADGQQHELLLSIERLPSEARRADAVLELDVRDGDVVDARYDPEETETHKNRAQSRFDRLSERAPDGDPDDPTSG